jgi:hypothetical protein
MRVCLLLAAACGGAPPAAPPRQRAVLDSSGWCPRPAATQPLAIARSFEVSTDLATVRPLRAAGFDSYEIGYDRDRLEDGTAPWLSPSIVNDKLRLSTWPTSCENTNLGCFDGYWSTPAQVALEDPRPVSGCIAYAYELPAGAVVLVGNELRTYLRRDDRPAIGPALPVPALAIVEMRDAINGRPVLAAGRDGTLWTLRWQDTPAPVVTQVANLGQRILSAARGDDGLVFVTTDRAVYALDERTFGERWHFAGEVWTVLSVDAAGAHDVLAIERTTPPRVVLHALDAHGTELRRVTVATGPVAAASLERSGVQIDADHFDPILVVRISN